MLCITNIKFLSKVEGLLDRLNQPQVVLRIVMDNNFILPQLLGKTSQNITNWNEHLIPPIELSPYVDLYKLQFNIYRQGVIIGVGTTMAKYNQTRKDVLDVIDKDNLNNGKLVYDLTWVSQYKGQYVTYQQYLSLKDQIKGRGGKEVVVPKQIKVEKVKSYTKEEGSQNCFCACFAVRKKRPQEPKPNQTQYPESKHPQNIQNNSSNKPYAKMTVQKQQKNGALNAPLNQTINKTSSMIKQQLSSDRLKPFRNHPFIYYEQQLEQGKFNDVQNLNRLNYYSKSYVISK